MTRQLIDIDSRVISQCRQKTCIQVWSPDHDIVVLGNGDRAELACYQERCQTRGVPILRRKGGGGAVLLHSHCIVVSIGLWVRHYFHNAHYFACTNAALIESLASYCSVWSNLHHRGLSDIAWGEQKVGGTSIFRSRNYLLYQASLLYQAEADRIATLLRHPQREPDYRRGRTHRQFLCGLADIAPDSEQKAVSKALRAELPHALMRLLAAELLAAPPVAQCEALLQHCV